MRYSYKITSFSNSRSFVVNFIRLLLFIGFLISMTYERKLVALMSLIGFVVTFIPWAFQYFFKINIPAKFESIILLFFYGVFVFGDVSGFYSNYPALGLILNLGSSIILGLVGLTILTVLSEEEAMEASPLIIAFFTFFFAFSLGTIWEIFEFGIDNAFGFGLQSGVLRETIMDLIMNFIGALLVSIWGYYQLISGKKNFISNFLSNIVKENFRGLKSKKYFEYSSNLIERIIERGESEKLEFKSTLRKNLKTGDFDRNLEHSVLKTLTAFMNSGGGTLIIGVEDSGKILGVNSDGFVSHDKLRLHLTNLIRGNLGNKCLPLLHVELYPVEDKHVLKIDCLPSERRIFLKWNGGEEFFIRHGPSSIKLNGDALIDYVQRRFG